MRDFLRFLFWAVLLLGLCCALENAQTGLRDRDQTPAALANELRGIKP